MDIMPILPKLIYINAIPIKIPGGFDVEMDSKLHVEIQRIYTTKTTFTKEQSWKTILP
jgi:hypothetical protein